MNDDRFWAIIDQAKGADVVKRLKPILFTLPPAEIQAFGEILAARIAELYRWDIWGIGYIVNGGCSDDGFEYFRLWVVTQGKDFYDRLAADPDGVFTDPKVTDCECEELTYAVSESYRQAARKEIPPASHKPPKEPRGKDWDEVDLKKLFPKTYAVYNA
ncbi:MAG: DUF4240 domain-containing protein [Planctomycetes bacterium]|nr:DUF4240 domain-containing protein [Planctomycetota bacterium]